MPTRKIDKRGRDATRFVRSTIAGTKFLMDTYQTLATIAKIAKAAAPVA